MPPESANYRSRSGTEGDSSFINIPNVSIDLDDAPYRAKLYQLFGMIEKEFDNLYADNCSLRARISQLTENDGEINHTGQEGYLGFDAKGSAKKTSQVGQKLRTALRPPGLGFKVTESGRFKLNKRLEGHKDGVCHVDSKKNFCVSASSDQSAKVWSLESATCIGTYLGHSGSVNCVAIGAEENETGGSLLVASASGDESAHLWRMPVNGQPTSEEEDDEKDPEDDKKQDGILVRNPVLRLTGHRAPVIGCHWIPNTQHLLTASWDRTAHIYDVEKGEILNILSGHEQELNHCSAHISQKLVATSSKDFTFRLWDFRDSIQSVAVFQGHQESVNSVAFSTGDKIVSSSDDRTMKIWDLRNMRTALATNRLSSAANKIAISKVHGSIAIPLDNCHVRIYDLNGNRLNRVPYRRCHTKMATSVAWADDVSNVPNCPNLVTGGFDKVVATWRITVPKEN